MTDKEIARFSAPVIQAYRDMEDELLRLIAKQIAKDGRLSDTSKWRIRQLARAGEVNRQALNIIDSYSGGISTEVYDAILAAAESEVGHLDAAMLNLLSEKGHMTDDAMNALQSFERQSRQELNVRNAEIAEGYASALSERCNLVNTVMGYSARSAYSQAVRDISAEVDRQSVIDTLNQGAASVVSGNMGLQEATRKVIHKLAEKGLPGFTDKAGRQWSPEAYVRMDLRSTMGNTARAAQDARCDAYGIALIEVSSHMGARPKCAPYQGRVFSRDGSRGTVEDLNGSPIEYIPLSETSYGEPDGLFGINCGHQQYPFIPGVSLKTYYPYDEAENAKRYEDTQRQRALERKIRADKRECMMLQETGDEEGLRKAAGQLRADRDRYQDFCKQTGLAAHNENTQVYGYDRSKSMKTVWAEKENSRLTNSADSGTMITTKLTDTGDVVNPMDEEKYHELKHNLEAEGISVISAAKGSDDEKFLKAFGAEAISDDIGILHLGRIPSASAMYEEMIHCTQIKVYGSIANDDMIERSAREVAANRHLLANGDKFGFTEQDYAEIKTNTKKWEKDFEQRVGEAYDKANYKRDVSYIVGVKSDS